MAPSTAVPSLLLSLTVLQQQTGTTSGSGDLLPFSGNDTPAPCLVQGRPSIRRDDYTYTPGIGGHKVHTTGATWNVARKICEQEDGYLAIINSPAESRLIGQLFRDSMPHVASADPNYVHIGFHGLFEEGEFVTIHGQSLRTIGFYDWVGGGPSNAWGLQHCGSVNMYGKLDDNYCNISCGFVCEVPYDVAGP